MKKIFSLLIVLALCVTACAQGNGNGNSNSNGGEENNMTNIKISVGNTVFSAKLYDNAATRVLLERFPLTLNMSDLHANEKYFYLPFSMPTNAERVGSIRTGDLMLYGSDCIVLFYKGFSTSYSYTRLGYIENTSGLVSALGSGSITVTFSME